MQHSQTDPLSKIDWSKIVRDVVSNGEASIICYARINDGNHYTKMTGVLEGYMLADGRICDLMAAKESVLWKNEIHGFFQVEWVSIFFYFLKF